MNLDFKECPLCHGYGVLDDGRNCKECGGHGRGPAGRGSGELLYDKETGRRVTVEEFVIRSEESK